MSLTRRWVVDGLDYGTGPAPNIPVHEQLQAPRSLVYICPVCGEAWARLEVLEGAPWVAQMQVCEKHPRDWLAVAGSLGLSWLGLELMEGAPKAVLYRELELHISHGLRYDRF